MFQTILTNIPLQSLPDINDITILSRLNKKYIKQGWIINFFLNQIGLIEICDDGAIFFFPLFFCKEPNQFIIFLPSCVRFDRIILMGFLASLPLFFPPWGKRVKEKKIIIITYLSQRDIDDRRTISSEFPPQSSGRLVSRIHYPS